MYFYTEMYDFQRFQNESGTVGQGRRLSIHLPVVARVLVIKYESFDLFSKDSQIFEVIMEVSLGK